MKHRHRRDRIAFTAAVPLSLKSSICWTRRPGLRCAPDGYRLRVHGCLGVGPDKDALELGRRERARRCRDSFDVHHGTSLTMRGRRAGSGRYGEFQDPGGTDRNGTVRTGSVGA